VALVRTDISEEHSASIVRVIRIGELKIMFGVTIKLLPVTANVVPISLIRVTLMMEEIRFSEMSVLTRATRRHKLNSRFMAWPDSTGRALYAVEMSKRYNIHDNTYRSSEVWLYILQGFHLLMCYT
jgi:hypothetical protein